MKSSMPQRIFAVKSVNPVSTRLSANTNMYEARDADFAYAFNAFTEVALFSRGVFSNDVRNQQLPINRFETRFKNIGVDTPDDSIRVRGMLKGALEGRV